jgi:hypothetical protein
MAIRRILLPISAVDFTFFEREGHHPEVLHESTSPVLLMH